MTEAMHDASTTTPAWRHLYVTGRDLVARVPFSLIQLMMRFGIGFVFLNAGLLKARSFEFAVRLFTDEYKLPLIAPELAARLAMAVEITIPLFLFAGLATRFATLPLLVMTFVIWALVYPGSWVESLLWASILLTLLVRGPGVISLDHLIEKVLRARTGA